MDAAGKTETVSDMSKTIWKYAIPVRDTFEVQMPIGAHVLTVQTQRNDGPFIWALVDPSQEVKERRLFLMHGTGHEIAENAGRYIGTFQMEGGALVFHLFETGVLKWVAM